MRDVAVGVHHDAAPRLHQQAERRIEGNIVRDLQGHRPGQSAPARRRQRHHEAGEPRASPPQVQTRPGNDSHTESAAVARVHSNPGAHIRSVPAGNGIRAVNRIDTDINRSSSVVRHYELRRHGIENAGSRQHRHAHHPAQSSIAAAEGIPLVVHREASRPSRSPSGDLVSAARTRHSYQRRNRSSLHASHRPHSEMRVSVKHHALPGRHRNSSRRRESDSSRSARLGHRPQVQLEQSSRVGVAVYVRDEAALGELRPPPAHAHSRVLRRSGYAVILGRLLPFALGCVPHEYRRSQRDVPERHEPHPVGGDLVAVFIGEQRIGVAHLHFLLYPQAIHELRHHSPSHEHFGIARAEGASRRSGNAARPLADDRIDAVEEVSPEARPEHLGDPAESHPVRREVQNRARNVAVEMVRAEVKPLQAPAVRLRQAPPRSRNLLGEVVVGDVQVLQSREPPDSRRQRPEDPQIAHIQLGHASTRPEVVGSQIRSARSHAHARPVLYLHFRALPRAPSPQRMIGPQIAVGSHIGPVVLRLHQSQTIQLQRQIPIRTRHIRPHQALRSLQLLYHRIVRLPSRQIGLALAGHRVVAVGRRIAAQYRISEKRPNHPPQARRHLPGKPVVADIHLSQRGLRCPRSQSGGYLALKIVVLQIQPDESRHISQLRRDAAREQVVMQSQPPQDIEAAELRGNAAGELIVIQIQNQEGGDLP